MSFNLTGTWGGDDGGIYALTQAGTTLWWAGLSDDGGLQPGLAFANVFQGQVSDQSITGAWADVPRGATMSSGQLALAVDLDASGLPSQLRTTSATGGFGAASWLPVERMSPTPPTIDDVFDKVVKNRNNFEDHTLLDGLKPYKDHAVVFGTVRESQLPIQVNYPYGPGFSYQDFACLGESDKDGDFLMNIEVDRALTQAQPGFWTVGWVRNASEFQAKLNLVGPNGANHLHCEALMYGGTTDCRAPEQAPLLPGWADTGGNSVLFNGWPINGNVSFDQTGRVSDVLNATDLGVPILRDGVAVRVSGVLTLDCGHYSPEHADYRYCGEDNPDYQNQEIHPVYAIDVITATPSRDLTGVWAGNDERTYYLHQRGETVWWLSLGPCRDQIWGQVFCGTYHDQTIAGSYETVYLFPTPGATPAAGDLTLTLDPTWLGLIADPAGSWAGERWTKLYNRVDTTPPAPGPPWVPDTSPTGGGVWSAADLQRWREQHPSWRFRTHAS